MKELLVLILLTGLPAMLTAQTYSPKAVGNKWPFRMGDNSFTDEIIEGTFSLALMGRVISGI